MQRKDGQAQLKPPVSAASDDLSLEQMVEAYKAMVVEKQRQISERGDEQLNVGQLLGSIMDAEVERRGYSKTSFKQSARNFETSKNSDCVEFQDLKRQYDSREGLAVAPREKAAKPPPKVLTDTEKRDSACRALGYGLEEGNYGSCALDRRCASLYLSSIANYPEFQSDLQKFVLDLAQRSKRAPALLKNTFRSFVLDPTRPALQALPDVDLDASRLHLSTLIPADHVTDVLGIADLERCAAYVERPACVAMALDVEKSPLSCTWRQLKPALIQIADGDRVFLLHSHVLGSSAEAAAIANRVFAALLGKGRTLAVFGDDDVKMLRALDFLKLPDHPLCTFADMKKMCLSSPSLSAQAGSKRGLADWVAIKWPGHVLSKAWTLSGWDMPSPLLEAQLEYAALDAAVTFALWQHCSAEKGL